MRGEILAIGIIVLMCCTDRCRRKYESGKQKKEQKRESAVFAPSLF